MLFDRKKTLNSRMNHVACPRPYNLNCDRLEVFLV